jgi:hypothetical protein
VEVVEGPARPANTLDRLEPARPPNNNCLTGVFLNPEIKLELVDVGLPAVSRKTALEACADEVAGLVLALLLLLLLFAVACEVEDEDVPNNLDLIVLL